MKKFNDRYIKEQVRKHFERNGLDFAIIDWSSLDLSGYDTLSSSLFENYGIDVEKLTKEPTEKEVTEGKRDGIKQISSETLKNFKDQEMQTAKTEKDPFVEARAYVQMVIKNHWESVLIVSETGLGKSHLILSELKEAKADYEYYNTYSTPLALVKILFEHADSSQKIIVLDDVDGILNNEKSISILKACLWSVNNMRIITYESTAKERENIPERFEFKGKIIILSNTLKSNENTRALESRANTCKIVMSHGDKLDLMKEIAKKPYKNTTEDQRMEIFMFIKRNSSEATENFNLRTFFKILEISLFDPECWKEISKKSLSVDPVKQAFLEIEEGNKDELVSIRIALFKEMTGLSRRSYFNYKRELKSA